MVNIAREAAQAVWGDLGRAEHAMSGWFEPHRAAPQAPAASPATVGNTTTTEEPMSLAALEATVREDLTSGVAYLKEFAARLEQAAPGILGNDAASVGPTAVRVLDALAGTFIPQPYEDMLVGIIAKVAADHGQPVQAAQPQQQPAA